MAMQLEELITLAKQKGATDDQINDMLEKRKSNLLNKSAQQRESFGGKARQSFQNVANLSQQLAGFTPTQNKFRDAFEAALGKSQAESLMPAQKSESEKILERAKLAEAAKTLGRRDIFDAATAGGPFDSVEPTRANTKQPVATAKEAFDLSSQIIENQRKQPGFERQDFGSINDIKTPEKDPFTGELTDVGAQQEIRNKLILSQLKDQTKNLSGESAVRFGGSVQGLEDIQDIINIIKLRKDQQGNIKVRDDISDLLIGQKAAGFREPSIPFTEIPISGGLLTGLVQLGAGEEARILELKLKTLAENVLRARTGAQAPETEQVREEQRSMLRLLDSPNVMLERLEENQRFLTNMVESVRRGAAPEVRVPTEQPAQQQFQVGQVINTPKGQVRVISVDPNDPSNPEVELINA